MQTTAKRNGSAADRSAVVLAFLRGVLDGGAVAVAELEVRARAAGLIGGRQKITDAKSFKAAKKKLGINSRRDGFGRGGEWFWQMPIRLDTEVAETAADLAPKAPPGVVYAEGHSRPKPRDHCGDPAIDERMQGALLPSEWIAGVAHLDLARAPRDVPPHRWRRLVTDCHEFLTSNWAVRAAEMGWDAAALFGCCSARPLDRLGSAGLLWNVAGGRLKQLHKDWAVIAAPDGSQRTYHRRPAATNFALPWRLR